MFEYFTCHLVPTLAPNYKHDILLPAKVRSTCEISSSHGGEYDVQSCLLGCTAV
jgi:hypothetical protein